MAHDLDRPSRWVRAGWVATIGLAYLLTIGSPVSAAETSEVELNPGTLPGMTEKPYSTRVIAPADFDGDGRTDLLSTEFVADHAIEGNLVLAEGSGGFGAPLSSGFFDNLVLSAADLDGDGFADLAAAYNEEVITLRGSGDGQFESGAPGGISPAFGDLDTDSDNDVFINETRLIDGRGVSVFLNDGSGSFSEPIRLQPAQGTLLDPVAGDFDGDGSPDIAACFDASEPGADGIALFLGDGAGGFSGEPAEGQPGVECESLAAGDVDGDGTDDLVTNRYDVLAGGSTGELSALGTIPSDRDPAESVSLAEMNGDGRLDAVFAGNGFDIWLGDGNGGFGSAPDLRHGGEVHRLQPIELDPGSPSGLVAVAGKRRIPKVWANVTGAVAAPPNTDGPSNPFSAARTLPDPDAFGSSDPDADLECSLDFGQWGSCETVLGGQPPDGRHFIAARAVSGGRVDPTPAQTAVRIDTVDPLIDVSVVEPAEGKGFPAIRVSGEISQAEPSIGGRVRVKGERTAPLAALTLLIYSDGFSDLVDQFDTRYLMSGSRAANRGSHEAIVRAVDEAGNVTRVVQPFRVR